MNRLEFWEWMDTCPCQWRLTKDGYDDITIEFFLDEDQYGEDEDGDSV